MSKQTQPDSVFRPDDAADRIVVQMNEPALLSRLRTALADAVAGFRADPRSFLRLALSTDRARDFLPIRFFREVGAAIAAFARHPFSFVRGALTPDAIGMKRVRKLTAILAICAVTYGIALTVLMVYALIEPYSNYRIVEHAYNKLDPSTIIHLAYPGQPRLKAPGSEAMTLEEIKKRDEERKRKAEQDRLEREKKEKEAEEEAARAAEAAKKAAEAKAAEAQKAAAASNNFGEINITPIKDIVGELYQMYNAGQLDMASANFKIMAQFRIAPDGSIPKDSIKIIKSSGSRIIDEKSLDILWQLGESHALGPLTSLSSNTIELEINDQVAHLSITSFAPSPEEAQAKVQSLKFLLGLVAVAQRKKNPVVAELLGRLTLKADNKRVDANMIVPRARASEMMQAQYGSKPAGTP